MKRIIIILILITSNSFGQNIDSEKIAEIDSIFSSINRLKRSEYKTFKSSGYIKKRKFIFFKKTIGSFNEDVIYIDDEILKITHTEFLNKELKNESYYYSNNKLIKYEIKLYDDLELNINEIISKAYYENGELIKFSSNKEWKFDSLKTYEEAMKLCLEYLQFKNFMNQ